MDMRANHNPVRTWLGQIRDAVPITWPHPSARFWTEVEEHLSRQNPVLSEMVAIKSNLISDPPKYPNDLVPRVERELSRIRERDSAAVNRVPRHDLSGDDHRIIDHWESLDEATREEWRDWVRKHFPNVARKATEGTSEFWMKTAESLAMVSAYDHGLGRDIFPTHRGAPCTSETATTASNTSTASS